MDQSIETLVSNPVYMAVAVVLALIILFGVIKKLIKLVMVVAAILILWVAYLVWTGDDVSVESIKEGVQTGVENVKEKVFETKEKVKETVEDKNTTVEDKNTTVEVDITKEQQKMESRIEGTVKESERNTNEKH